MANKNLIFGAAAILALTAGASAQTAVIQPKAASAPQTVTLTADAAANLPPAPLDSAARGGTPAARLSITTDPPEAAVKIDGRDYGLSPVEAADLDTGSHVIELSKSGYFRRKATIRLDTAAAELRFELSRPATLVVTSEPSGARITIDGQNAGTSPVQNDKMRPGGHQVSADLDGYKRFEAAVNLESGTVDTLRITLEPAVTAPPQEPEQEQVKKADKAGKSRWQSSTILIAFFIFIAVLIGVEKSSY